MVMMSLGSARDGAARVDVVENDVQAMRLVVVCVCVVVEQRSDECEDVNQFQHVNLLRPWNLPRGIALGVYDARNILSRVRRPHNSMIA
jgi:hypothetical protein